MSVGFNISAVRQLVSPTIVGGDSTDQIGFNLMKPLEAGRRHDCIAFGCSQYFYCITCIDEQ